MTLAYEIIGAVALAGSGLTLLPFADYYRKPALRRKAWLTLWSGLISVCVGACLLLVAWRQSLAVPLAPPLAVVVLSRPACLLVARWRDRTRPST